MSEPIDYPRGFKDGLNRAVEILEECVRIVEDQGNAVGSMALRIALLEVRKVRVRKRPVTAAAKKEVGE